MDPLPLLRIGRTNSKTRMKKKSGGKSCGRIGRYSPKPRKSISRKQPRVCFHLCSHNSNLPYPRCDEDRSRKARGTGCRNSCCDCSTKKACFRLGTSERDPVYRIFTDIVSLRLVRYEIMSPLMYAQSVLGGALLNTSEKRLQSSLSVSARSTTSLWRVKMSPPLSNLLP